MKRTPMPPRKAPLLAGTLRGLTDADLPEGVRFKKPRATTIRASAIRPAKPRKPLKQGRSTGKPTDAEAWRLVTIKKLGCICCMLNMQFWMPVPFRGACEAHHLLSGGRRRGHMFTVGLCRWHHRAVPPREGMGEAAGVAVYGPTVATGSKPFHAMYGTDDELLEFQNALLARVPA